MLKSSISQHSGYHRLEQGDSFDEGYFDTSEQLNHYKSKKRPPVPRASSFPRQRTSYWNIQYQPAIMEENDSIYSISAPERSVVRHSSGLEDDNASSVNSSAWSQFSKKFKLRKKKRKDSNIYMSVFIPIPELKDYQPSSAPLTPNHQLPLTDEQFNDIIDSVNAAIASGMLPQRISQGSSGSYFCRNKEGKIVGVFKPKNEEPYGHLNPKWTKWIHRNLFPCCFGRSCLIPNLGYISESAASILDQRLKLNVVPITKVVSLSSPSFHYDYLDRHASKSKQNPKPLPAKIGSFQVFLDGFKDANVFLRDHPWPDSNQDTIDQDVMNQERNHSSRLDTLMCRGTNIAEDERDMEEYYPLGSRFTWTSALQNQFTEQFEKLVILDYLMRNTDRGLDNWMIKYCEKDESVTIAVTPPKPVTPMMARSPGSQVSNNINEISLDPSNVKNDGSNVNDSISKPTSPSEVTPKSSGIARLLAETESNTFADSVLNQPPLPYPHIHVAAIDNGLAFPFKHPDSWRSYPYGWPQSLICRPFTTNTRRHFLSMLTSPLWWKQTVADLRELFAKDDDFDEGMFEKQIAVLKGQGWNIVETLNQADQGPFDLIARQNVVVVDEEEEIDDDADDIGTSDAENIDHEVPPSVAHNEEETGEPSSERPEIPPKMRRSMSEDSASIQRPSAAASVEGRSSLSISSSRRQRWAAKLRTTLNFDSGKDADHGKRKKLVVVERLETVNGAVPFFTCC